jgi:pimeloyl-ACP methyl ester carboxylesterase
MTPPPTQYAQNGDARIAYEVFGDPASGEPLLLIMGLDFQMVWWPDDLCRLLVEHGFAVVRFDNRDTGLSTHFASPARRSPWRALMGRVPPIYTGTDMLDDALAVMDAVGWRSAHVMGASMGAAIAQSLALLHPERVRSLTSVMGLPVDSGPLRTLTYIRFGVFRKLRRLRPGTTREERIEFLVGIARAIGSPGYPFAEEWVREAATISDDRSPRDPTTTQRHLAAGRAVRLPPISRITVPTLVISGEDDPIVSVRGGRDTARAIPGATLVTYPGMGHDLPAALWPEIVGHVSAVTRRWAGAA